MSNQSISSSPDNTMVTKPDKKQSNKTFGINKLFFLAGAILIGFLITLIPIAGLPMEGRIALGIFVFTVLMWIFEVLPTGVTAVLFGVLLVVILGKEIMPTKTAFAGFTNETWFLILGAFLIGEASAKTGLAERIALYLMRLGGSSYKRVIVYVWLASIVLGLLTPSGTVRVVIFIPIMAGIVAAYKAPLLSNFTANLFMHVYWASIIASNFWYTGTNINPLAMGIAGDITGYTPSFLTWTIWQIIPCLVFSVAAFFVINWVFPPGKELIAEHSSVGFIDKRLGELGKVKSEEWRALAILACAIVLWITEPIHGIATAWVAIGAGALLFLPGVGVLGRKSLNTISWDTLLLLGIALGIGGILKATGLDIWITETLLNPLLAPFANKGIIGIVFGITIVTALIHFLMASGSSETAALAPLMAKWASAHGFNVALTTLVVSRSAMNVLLFPFQSTPMLAMWGTNYLDMKKAIKGFGALSLLNIVWITAMGPYWNWIMTVVK